jgi:pimeloyl-ACP methyl ester carboxylesterase
MPETPGSDDTSSSRSWSRATWTLAATTGAAAAVAGLRALTRRGLSAPSTLPPALSAPTRTVALPHGNVNFYHRPGTGTPLVFVHSFNAAASSFELEPLFHYFAETTKRPLYAIDWLGFGRSDRPDIDYAPDLYQTHLFRFLDEIVETPADLVALSLGSEYAAYVTLTGAPLVRKLVLLNPTGLGKRRGASAMAQAMIRGADATGLFELLFFRLTRPASLRDFYERQIFLRDGDVPDALVDYAHVTSRARGAHHAPRRFIEGTLFLEDVASDIYSRLYRPTLILTPADPTRTVQRFDSLPDVLGVNPRDLQHEPLPGGLLPHWESGAPSTRCTDAIHSFLSD